MRKCRDDELTLEDEIEEVGGFEVTSIVEETRPVRDVPDAMFTDLLSETPTPEDTNE